MKSFVSLAVPIAIAAAALGACSFRGGDDDKGPGIAGTGTGNARSYAVQDFTGVESSAGDNVDVRVGSGFSVRAEGPADELDKLRIVKDGDRLAIGRRGHHLFGSRGDRLTITVTMPRIASASIAGSGNMSVDRVEGSSFKGEIAGSGSLSLKAVQVEDASFAIAGSGDVEAAGTARSLNIDIAGSGGIKAAGLTAQRAKVSIAGSGDVRATVDGEAKVDIMGAGDVELGGKARCTVDKMGSGSVRCGG